MEEFVGDVIEAGIDLIGAADGSSKNNNGCLFLVIALVVIASVTLYFVL